MEQIKNYLISIIFVSAAAVIADLITPEGERGAIKKNVRLLVSLAALAVLLTPLGKAFSFIADYDNYKDFFNFTETGGNTGGSVKNAAAAEDTRRWILGRGETELSSGINILLDDKFGIPAGEARVYPELEQSEEGIVVKKILIIISGGSVWKNPHEIEDYISSMLGCTCEVLA